MTATKHTPGPWKFFFEADGTNVYAGNRETLICSRVEQTHGVGDIDANARLIEAAPDLLAACLFILENAGKPPVDMLTRVRAAVEKATSGR